MFRSVFRVSAPFAAQTARKSLTSFKSFRFYSAANLSRDDVTSKIINVVKSFDKTVASADISEKTVFTKDLGLDSLDIVELLVAIEEEFDIEIPDKIADDIKSVSDAVDYVASNPEATSN